jgi:hypothetical protein
MRGLKWGVPIIGVPRRSAKRHPMLSVVCAECRQYAQSVAGPGGVAPS